MHGMGLPGGLQGDMLGPPRPQRRFFVIFLISRETLSEWEALSPCYGICRVTPSVVGLCCLPGSFWFVCVLGLPQLCTGPALKRAQPRIVFVQGQYIYHHYTSDSNLIETLQQKHDGIFVSFLLSVGCIDLGPQRRVSP